MSRDNPNDVAVLSVLGEDGRERNYFILTKFAVGSRDYIALAPQNSEDRVELFRCEDGGGRNVQIYNIASDMELTDVKREYERIMQSEYAGLIEEQDTAAVPAITVKGDDGKEYVCEIIATFTYNDKDYIALLPCDNADSLSIQLFGYHVTPMTGAVGFENLYLEEIPVYLYSEVRDYFISLAAD